MKQLFTLMIAGMMVMTGTAQQRVNSRMLPDHRPWQSVIPEPGLRAFNIPDWQMQTRNGSISGNELLKSRVLMQQLDSYENQYYDEIAMAWINDSKNEFTYDVYGNNTVDILSVWNTDTELYELSDKQEFEYENGFLIEQLYFSYDAENMEWVQNLRWLYSYDEDGNLTISYIYFWNGSSWDMTARNVRTYDEGFLISDVSSYWDESTNSWMNNSKEEYSYDPYGHLIVTTGFMWDMITEEWRNFFKYENTYEGDFLTESTSYSWDIINGMWVTDYMNEYTYDENLNMVNNMEFEWNGTTWVLTWEADFTYNNDYTIDELLLPWFYGEAGLTFMHMLTDITEYADGSIVPTDRSMLYYSEVDITGIPENESAIAVVYPQPARDEVMFRLGDKNQLLDLSIFDLSGKLALVQQIASDQPVALSNLLPGLYFYRLSGNSAKVYTGKLSVL